MFEKEAEEYAEKAYCNSTEIDYYGIADAFQDGAEFGYNKANEWYYLSKGEYPPLETDLLICIKLLNNNKAVKIGAFQQCGGLLIEGFIVSIDAAIAWKSLPNLPTED